MLTVAGDRSAPIWNMNNIDNILQYSTQKKIFYRILLNLKFFICSVVYLAITVKHALKTDLLNQNSHMFIMWEQNSHMNLSQKYDIHVLIFLALCGKKLKNICFIHRCRLIHWSGKNIRFINFMQLPKLVFFVTLDKMCFLIKCYVFVIKINLIGIFC